MKKSKWAKGSHTGLSHAVPLIDSAEHFGGPNLGCISQTLVNKLLSGGALQIKAKLLSGDAPEILKTGITCKNSNYRKNPAHLVSTPFQCYVYGG